MPLIYTGPEDIVDHLYQVYRRTVPRDIASSSRSLDEAWVAANMVALGEGQVLDWGREAHIGTADGIWLDQHAKDHGLRRQTNELDAHLRIRLRSAPQAVTYNAIYQALSDVITAINPAALWYLLRIPIDVGAFCDIDCWCDADSRVTETRLRMLVLIIPASLDSYKGVLLDVLRSKVAAGTIYTVEEY